MKKIDHDTLQIVVTSIYEQLFKFKTKYTLTEASLWDLIHMYWHYSKHSKGISNGALVLLRYGSNTGYQYLVNRKQLLIKKDMVYTLQNKNYLSEHIYKELQSIFNVRTALPHCTKTVKSRRSLPV